MKKTVIGVSITTAMAIAGAAFVWQAQEGHKKIRDACNIVGPSVLQDIETLSPTMYWSEKIYSEDDPGGVIDLEPVVKLMAESDRKTFAGYPHLDLLIATRSEIRRRYKDFPKWERNTPEAERLRDVTMRMVASSAYDICRSQKLP